MPRVDGDDPVVGASRDAFPAWAPRFGRENGPLVDELRLVGYKCGRHEPSSASN
jgi:hypothetical protein